MLEKLKDLNLQVKEKVLTENAAPIVGLVEIGSASDNYIELFVEYLAGSSDNFRSFFVLYPFATAWVVTQILRNRYAEDGYSKFYPILEDHLRLEFPVNGNSRTILKDGFKKICKHIGVPTDQLKRPTQLYLAQSGVPYYMLHHLATAFIRQERHYGPPPIDNSHELNVWEDNALFFLPETVSSPRYSISLDDTGWHALLYANLKDIGEVWENATEFERSFHKLIHDYRSSERLNSAEGAMKPKPKISWKFDSIVLEVPKIERRMQLWPEDTNNRLLLPSGRPWTLPVPWPRKMAWKIGDSETQYISFLTNEDSIAIFDRNSGILLDQYFFTQESVVIDAVNLVIVSRSEFKLNDVNSNPIREGAYIAFCKLDKESIVIELGIHKLELKLKRTRRILHVGDPLASGPSGSLLGHENSIYIDSSFGTSGDLNIALIGGDRSVETTLKMDEFGRTELSVPDVLTLLNSDHTDNLSHPFKLQIEIKPIVGEEFELTRAGIFKSSFWIWPETTLSEDGFCFNCPVFPTNFEDNRALHVHRNEQSICLDEDGTYDLARICFFIDDRYVDFEIPSPDVTCTLQTTQGDVKFIPHGKQILLGTDERYSTIVIRSPDREAELMVRGQKESKPFRNSKTYTIMLLDLINQSPDSRVLYLSSSEHRIELFRVVEATTPKSFSHKTKENKILIDIEVHETANAFSISIEDDQGTQSTVEIALLGDQFEVKPPDWIKAELSSEEVNLIHVSIDQSFLPEGLYYSQYGVRPKASNSWNTLSDKTGRTYALVLSGKQTEDQTNSENQMSLRFRSISRWLSRYVSEDSFSQILKILEPVWRDVGESLFKTIFGRRELLVSSLMEPEDSTNLLWITTKHPIIFLPELYGSDPDEFTIFATSPFESTKNLATVATLSSGRLRDMDMLSFAAMISFDNSFVAQESGVRLKGFNPKRFMENITHDHIDVDTSAGFYWQDSPVLGPEHLRAAHLKFVERLEYSELIRNSNPLLLNRWKRVNILITKCSHLPNLHVRTKAPEREKVDEELKNIENWVANTICDFAYAARNKSVEEWAKNLAQNMEVPHEQVLADIGYLLRLAPELFAFYMGMWQLTHRDKEIQNV